MIANALKGKLLVFSVFFAGMIAGALGIYVYETRISNSALAAAVDRQQTSQSVAKKLADYVGLDEKQEKQVEEIMRATGAESRKLYEPIRPQVETLREQSRTQIRAVLTEEQKVKYEQWRAERAAARAKSKSN